MDGLSTDSATNVTGTVIYIGSFSFNRDCLLIGYDHLTPPLGGVSLNSSNDLDAMGQGAMANPTEALWGAWHLVAL